MPDKSAPWIAIDRIEAFIQPEPAIILLGFALCSWIVPRIFLRNIEPERTRSLQILFKNLGYHLIFGVFCFIVYSLLRRFNLQPLNVTASRIATYVGLVNLFMGSAIFVKTCRIFVFQYFFLSHKNVAFPVLLVNLFTLLLSILLATWLSAEIFNIRLAPILATSALFSLVLGLAMQDTLGNLFAGIALQFDKPYEIGDWIEIQTQGYRWVGQVYEISWRATLLVASTEETITVPNRIVAQAQVSNFSTRFRPILRFQIFRIPFRSDIPQIKNLLLTVAGTIQEIRKSPMPKAFVFETTESWIGFKLIYAIDNFGRQTVIADQLLSQCIAALESAGVSLASQRVIIQSSPIPEISNYLGKIALASSTPVPAKT